MKNSFILFVSVILLVASTSCTAQSWKKLQEKAKETVNDQLGSGEGASKLSNDEVVRGLKEALKIGSEKAVASASKVGGFNQSSLIRIPFPKEAEEVKDFALKVGMDSQVEEFETTMNKAAEKASDEAQEILVGAITGMSVQDGFKILNGGDTAATHYLRTSTSNELRTRFKPIVEKAINEVELTKYWNPMASAYNKNPFKKREIDPDLVGYVTDKALDGLFVLVKQEEQSIRENPQARVTDLLKKVFGGE